VSVQVGAARALVPMDRLTAVRRPSAQDAGREGVGATRVRPKVAFEGEPPDRGLAESAALGEAFAGCDLRGLRVEEALGRLVVGLDRAAVTGQRSLVVLHGLGSGALRDAVRAHLTSSPYVVSFARGGPHEGGDGVTVVQLEASEPRDR